MNLQNIYIKLLESIKANSVKDAWDKVENKKNFAAAYFLMKVHRAFSEIYAEISDTNPRILSDDAMIVPIDEDLKIFVFNKSEEEMVIYVALRKEYEENSSCYSYCTIKKSWLTNTYDELCNYAYEEIKKCVEHDKKIVKEKTEELKVILEDIDFFNKRIYKNDALYESLKTQNEICEGDIMLRNRYSIDIRLRPQGSKTKWKFIVPEKDAGYIQLSYEGTKDDPTYVSIDPPGGPMLTLGENEFYPYACKEPIVINIKRIYEENGGWFLETDEVK